MNELVGRRKDRRGGEERLEEKIKERKRRRGRGMGRREDEE